MNLSEALFAGKSIAWNTIAQFIGKAVAGICALFLVGFLTRRLGADGFGICATLFAWISTLIVIADMGLYLTGVRRLSVAAHRAADSLKSNSGEEAKTEGNAPAIIGNLFSARLVIAVAAVCCAGGMLAFLPYDHELKKIICLALPSVILVSAARTFKSAFQAGLIMHCAVAAEVIGMAVMTALAFTLVHSAPASAYLGESFCSKSGFGGYDIRGIYAVVIGLLAGCLVHFAISYAFAKPARMFRISFDAEYIKKLLKEALPLGISAIMAILYFRFDMLMLSWMKPAEDVGIYGAAYIIVEMAVVLPALFLGSMLPYFSRAISTQKENLDRYYSKSFNFLTLIAVPFLAGGLVLAKPLTGLIAGAEFGRMPGAEISSQALPHVFQILVAVSFLIFWGQLNGHLLVAGSRQKTILKIYFFMLPLNIVLNIILIPPFSYNGAALATLLSEVAALVLTTLIVKKNFNLLPEMHVPLRAGAAALIMVLVLYLIGCMDTYLFDFHVILLILIGAATYSFVMAVFFRSTVARFF